MTKKIRKAVIPAAGFGTRFLPITKVIPKELLPIGNKPAIQYVVEEAVASGIEEIILVSHPTKEAIINYFKSDPSLTRFLKERGKEEALEELKKLESLANFRVVYQEEALGLGHAVGCAEKAVGQEHFVVLLPDVILTNISQGTPKLVRACQEGTSWGVLLEQVSRERISSYGIVRGKWKEEGREITIEGAVEKPKPEEAPSDLGILGRYFFPPEIFEWIAASGKGALGEIQLTDAINQLAQQQAGCGLIYREKLFDVGTPSGLSEAAEFFRKSPQSEK